MTGRKFYRSIVTVEVLTADSPAEFDDLSDLHYLITEGHGSGRWDFTSQEVSAEQIAELLIAQGSDAEFLLGDDDEDDA